MDVFSQISLMPCLIQKRKIYMNYILIIFLIMKYFDISL